MSLQAALLAALCNGLLDTVGIREEIDRREAQGFWAAGAGGIGGAFPMHVRKAKSERAAAAKAAASLKAAVSPHATHKRLRH